MIDNRILICAAASLVGHLAFSEALSWLPERASSTPPRRVEIRVIEAPPPPPPPPEPTPIEPVPAPPTPAPPTPAPPRPRPPRATPITAPVEPPPTATPSSTTTTSTAPTQPVFGVTMESTSSGGQGPAVPVGNTTAPGGPSTASRPGPSAPATSAPVPAAEVTKMPLPKGRCAGKYTDDARAAGVEGVVVLDLVVDANGVPRDIVVVEGLSHGLTEAAIAAIKACTFTPGERAGSAVPVRVRGFKIRFVLDQAM